MTAAGSTAAVLPLLSRATGALAGFASLQQAYSVHETEGSMYSKA